MLSKQEGKNFVIATDKYDKYPTVINQKKTIKTIDDLMGALCKVRDTMRGLVEKEEFALYTLLENNALGYFYDDSDGESWRLNDTIYSLGELKNMLETHNDTITPREQLITLEDIGYHDAGWEGSRGYKNGKVLLYEHELENIGDRIEDEETTEVTEEVILQKGKEPVHRIRTIVMEKTDYGRSSKSITYKKKPINKKLQQVIDNTIAMLDKEE